MDDLSLEQRATETYETLGTELEHWLHDSQATLINESALRHLAVHLGRPEVAKAFYLASSKRFGLMRGLVHEGDIVTLLAGSMWPMMLRPCMYEQQNVYKVVGQCYLEGRSGMKSD